MSDLKSHDGTETARRLRRRGSVLECASPLALLHPIQSARGLAQSKTSRQVGESNEIYYSRRFASVAINLNNF